MNGHRFDDLTRAFGFVTSRRSLLGTVAVGAITAFLGANRGATTAQPTCDAPLIECGGTCVNAAYDPMNCGACNNACAEGESCQGGACSGEIPCDGCGEADVCIDFATDDAHCGGCDNPCAAGVPCRGGRCLPAPVESTPLAVASPGAIADPTCRVAPRSGFARTVPDGTPGASLGPTSDATPTGAGPVFPTLAENQLPAGDEVGPEVVAAITSVVEQVAACAAPASPKIIPATNVPVAIATPVGTPPAALPVADLGVEPVFALYSDDYFRRPGVVTTGGIAYWAPAGPGPLAIRGVRRLADGRIGAFVEGTGAPVFLVFAEMDGAYAIDEVVIVGPGGATPAA